MSIKINTHSIISKLYSNGGDVTKEIVAIFHAKFLNFVRNPYSIKKVLNTFSSLKDLYPTNLIHYESFRRVLDGKKPHQSYLCKILGVSNIEYEEWLGIIFLLLVDFKNNSSNMFEEIVGQIFTESNKFVFGEVYTYDDKSCLLSDRGYSNIYTEDCTSLMVWDFNLYSNGFIRYIFGNVDDLAPSNVPKEIIELYKLQSSKRIDFYWRKNDYHALERYNKNVIYQCYEKVFSSSDEVYGL
jgi:hypothetical protein